MDEPAKSLEKNDDDYLVEQFTLDEKTLPDIVKLIDHAFSPQSRSGVLSFDEETMNLVFNSPYTPRDAFVRVVFKPTGETVGFMGGVIRILGHKKVKYRFGAPGYLSVHNDHRQKGLAVKITMKLIEVAEKLKVDGAFLPFDRNEHGLDVYRHMIRDHGLSMQKIITIDDVLIRVWDVDTMVRIMKTSKLERFGLKMLEKLDKVSNPLIHLARPNDHEQIFRLMGDLVEKNDFAVIRIHDDFMWFMQQRGVICVVHENTSGEVDGFIIAWKMMLACSSGKAPFGWLDTVHLYNLSLKDSVDLCKYLCIAGKQAGWLGIQYPYIPYFNPLPFFLTKFILYPRYLVFYASFMRPLDFPKKVSKKFYLSWR